MNMRFTCISTISAFRNNLPPVDAISFLYADTVRKEMGNHAIFVFAVADHDMISAYIRSGAISLSLCDDWRIWKVVYHRNDNTICWGQNIFCIAEVIF